MSLHINDIKVFYDRGEYTYRDEVRMEKLPENHIFDEDLSVRINREMVIEHNNKVDEYKVFKREKQAELDRRLAADVVAYIKEYYHLTDYQARLVESKVYEDYHSFMYDYFCHIDIFAEFAEELLATDE
jgi:hypothetical protein